MQPIAVFDTNVVLSAIGWKGKPLARLELARTGAIVGVTCPELLDELAGKLKTKLDFGPEKVAAAIAFLESFLKVIPIPNQLPTLQVHPTDTKVLECGIVAGATHIVTGDRRRLLPLGAFQGIPILTPTEFLAAISLP